MISDKVTLVIRFEVNTLKIPDLHFSILGNDYSIPNKRTVTVSIDKGEYDIGLTIPFMLKKARTDYHINLDTDKELNVGWSKMWGKITAKEITTRISL